MKNSSKIMPIDIFQKIINKTKKEGYKHIDIYNWMEPFLCNNLHEYIFVVKNSGLGCSVSSNLSLNPKNFENIKKSLMAGLDSLIVSVSGYAQDIYEINHSGGNISWIQENLQNISELIKKNIIKTSVKLRFIKFDYNLKEEKLLSEYAKSLGIDFEVIPGGGHPQNPIGMNYENIFLDGVCNVNSNKIKELKGKICPLISDKIAIDSQGDVYLCCCHPYFSCLRIGSYLEMTKGDILLQRINHTFCLSCNWQRVKMPLKKNLEIIKSTLYRNFRLYK